MNHTYIRNSRRAFSLVELMVVVVILGLLASVVVPNLIGKSDDAKQKLVTVQMNQLHEALKLFRIDIGRYPTTQEGLQALVKQPKESPEFDNYTTNGYLGKSSVPLDPWNNEYVYMSNGQNIEIISFGADGEENGDGINKDIKLSDTLK